jgi:integrase/recombinase XerD
MNQTTPPTNAIAAFLAMLAAERGAAKNTLDAYRRDLEDAADFFNPPVSLDTATTDALRLYLDHLAKTGLKASSAQRKTSALRQYFRFLYAENRRPDDPTTLISAPKRGRPLPKILTIDTVTALLTEAERQIVDPTNTPGRTGKSPRDQRQRRPRAPRSPHRQSAGGHFRLPRTPGSESPQKPLALSV